MPVPLALLVGFLFGALGYVIMEALPTPTGIVAGVLLAFVGPTLVIHTWWR